MGGRGSGGAGRSTRRRTGDAARFGRVATWRRWHQVGVRSRTIGGCEGCRPRHGCKACGAYSTSGSSPNIGGRFVTISGCMASSSGRNDATSARAIA